MESIETTLTERGSRYGSFDGHAKVTQALKRACHAHAGDEGVMLNPSQAEAIDMICHKLGRIVNGDPNYADSWVDIAGYATLVVQQLEANQ